MLSNLYLLKFNNYYNRQLKKELSLEDYEPYILGPGLPNINFIPNDGVSTKQIVNWNYDIPDYLLVTDDEQNILSRWFVIESVRNLKGQFELTLFRDTLADYLDEILNAPIFIEKGPLSDNDPFIFNNEDMTFNQIKKSELMLQDRYTAPWLIGYMTTDNPEDSSYSFDFEYNIDPDFVVTDQSQIPSVVGVSEGNYRILQDWGYRVYGNYGTGGNYTIDYKWTLAFNSNGGLPVDYPNGTEIGFSKTPGTTNSALNMFNISKANDVLNKYISEVGGIEENTALVISQMGIEGEDAFYEAIGAKNKIVFNSTTGKYYRIDVKSDIVWSTHQAISGTPIWNKLVSLSDIVREETTLQKYTNVNYNNDTFGWNAKCLRASVTYTEFNGVPVNKRTVEISRGRNILEDAPYCMFAIPFADNRWCEKDGYVVNGSVEPEIALDFVNSMSKALSGVGVLTDIQLLPYCPLQERLVGGGGMGSAYMDISKLVENADYQYIKLDEIYNRGIMMYWCKKSTFSFDIDTTLLNPFAEFSFNGVVLKEGKDFPVKLWNETTKYRLSAPNFSSAFDFSPAKNGGVYGFNVDCTYKPFQPYIHINPKFNGLYGKDFNDARGLIYTGDCSLTQLNDAWQTYQWQNINYEKTFQRQIENMDIQHKYAGISDKLNALTGTISGTTTGAMSGFMMGGGYGAIAGGVVGGVSSLAGGIADVSINKILRDEAKDYTIDLYNYQLGNIQALPTTLSKVSAFTANNKIYPLIEEYGCTDMEIEAFINKLKYNGCTVMRIGTLNEFLLYKNMDYNYFKGKLIRLEGIADDFHIVNTIAGELNKGVFI